MSQDRKFDWSALAKGVVPTACLLSVVAVLIVAILNAQSEKPGAQATPIESFTDVSFEELVADGNKAFQQKNWKRATEVYEKIVSQNPDDAVAWFRLGYCLHLSKQYDAALNAYRHAQEMPRLKPVAYYNMSCAYALKRMKQECLTYLRKSIEAGFHNPRPIAADPDFAAYLDDPEFQKLAGIAGSAEHEVPNRQFDFWIGKWDVYDATGRKVGVNEITKSENGYLLTERWKNLRSKVSGTSVNYYDPRARRWKQVRVDAQGGIIRSTGRFQNGKMALTGDYYDGKGEHGLSQATWTPLKDGRIHQSIRLSTDGGSTWKTHFSGYYTRQYSTL